MYNKKWRKSVSGAVCRMEKADAAPERYKLMKERG